MVQRAEESVAALNECLEAAQQRGVIGSRAGRLVLRSSDFVAHDFDPLEQDSELELDDAERDALELLVAGEVESSPPFESPVAARTLSRLQFAGLVTVVAGNWRVTRKGRQGIAGADLRAAHGRWAEQWATAHDDVARRMEFRHRCFAHQFGSAWALFENQPSFLDHGEPAVLRRALRELVRALDAEQVATRAQQLGPLLELCRALVRVGEQDPAVRLLEDARTRRDGSEEQRDAVLHLLGDAYVRKSRLEDAEGVFRTGQRRARGSEREGAFVRGLADVLLRRANPRGALRILEAYLARGSALVSADDRAALGAQHALALLELGSAEKALLELRRALALERGQGRTPRLAMLLLNYAVAARRLGRTELAIDATREALEIQEERGALSSVALLQRNLGVYFRDAGRDAEARHHLETARELHAALGEHRGAALADGSLGLLDLARGRLGPARRFLDRSAATMQEYGQAVDRMRIEAAVLRLDLVRGEWRGWSRRCARLVKDARDAGFTETEHELTLLGVERALGARRWEDANQALGSLEDGGERLAPRHRRRCMLLRSVLCRLLGDARAAAVQLDRIPGQEPRDDVDLGVLCERLALDAPPTPKALDSAEHEARAVGDGLRLLEVLLWREAWFRMRHDGHGEQAAKRARDEVLDSLAQSDTELRRGRLLAATTVLRRPPRSGPEKERQGDDVQTTGNLELLRTFLNLNKQLSAATDAGRLLEHLLDTAIALSGAQRGFLLLETAEGTKFESARSLRSGGLSEPEAELSRGLVEEAIEKMRPILTSNAGLDPRFRERHSVHQLDLRSVLCVPFPVDDDAKGALYLDNPIRAGVFGDRELDLVDALADQASIALRNLRARQRIESMNQQLEVRVRTREAELARAERDLERSGEDWHLSSSWIGDSPAFREATELLDRFATTELAVLITGESGTGKELAARRVHDRSPRADQAFVSENCSAIPETLLEAEFFGVVKGAFTGAEQDRPGLFRLAHGGTLFLDEIGDLPLALQAKLLRVLQEGAVRPVGAAQTEAVDVRIVCATHQDLRKRIAEKRFRDDLYYRIAAAEVRLPALREREGDLLPLAQAFLDELNLQHGLERHFGPKAQAAMAAYDWPGNVRQLRNEVHKCFAIARGDEMSWTAPNVSGPAATDAPLEALFAEDAFPTLKELEQWAIRAALERAGGNKEEAARTLGISRASIYEKVRRLREAGDS